MTQQRVIEVEMLEFPRRFSERLQVLLDKQDKTGALSPDERQEAEYLVDLAEFVSLLRTRIGRAENEC